MKEILFRDRKEWREWLAEHHDSESEIWLVYYKKHTGKQSVRYEEAVQEALCFGWIDLTVNKIDEERYRQRYTPRRAKSIWSKSNKARVEKLIENGLMAEAGFEKIEAAKMDGSWSKLDALEGDPLVPDDLQAALDENPGAKENFEEFTPSQRKQYLWWLQSAKRAETKEKRVREIVRRAEENIKPGI